MSTTKNIGQVVGLFIGTSAPQNTTLIWFDSTTNQRCHKVFDPKTGLWKVLEPGIVALTTYSELVNNAKKNGLSIGKFYQITDKSNVLAITIGTTKIQYVDSLGNILVDDLGTNIQYHVSSGNLLIDDVVGVFDTDTNKLVFSFKEQDPSSDDYVLGKKRNGIKWDLFKFKISSLISKNANNSITWNKGFFFNFTQSIKSLLNKTGGIVGYDEYSQKTEQIDKQLKEVSKENQTIIQDADKKVTEKTEATAIFDKKIPKNIDVTVAPGDVLLNDTLFNIVSKFQCWINQFKYATGIRLSKSYSDAKKIEYINNNDTVESAFAKIQYILKNPTVAGMLPSDWSTAAKRDNGGTNNESEIHTAFFQDGYPVAGDSIFYAFAKIVDFIKQSGKAVALSSDWKQLNYRNNTGIPNANDNLDLLVKKIVSILKKVDISWNKIESTADANNQVIIDFDKASVMIDKFATIDKKGIVTKTNYAANDSGITMPGSTVSWSTINVSNFFKLESGDYYSAALSAKNLANNSYSFDAAFNRLLVGRMVMNYIDVGAGSYTVSDKCFIINNVMNSASEVYLPSNPSPGTIIFMCPANKGSVINVHAGGNNGFDQVGSAVANLTLNNRGVTFFFAWTMPGVFYENSSSIIGLWSWGKFGH